MLSAMSLGHTMTTPTLEPVGSNVPWQFRVRPALFVAVASIVAIFTAIGGLFLVRRLTGALNAHLSLQTMLLVALTAAATLAFSRIAWRRNFPLETPEDLSTTDRVLGWASSAALLLLAIGCCYPGNQTTDWLIWLPLLVADQFWRQNFFDAGEPWVPSDEEEIELPTSPTIALTDTPQRDSSQLKNIVQQIFREQDEQGHDIIYGTVRADFVAGQRTAVVHVGFCPPLAYLPEIEAETLPGPLLQNSLDQVSPAKIKVVQALAHGTRLDIRLPKAATDDGQLWIDLAARPEAA